MITIVLFDDNKNIRLSIQVLIESTGNMKLAGAFANCENLVSKIHSLKPDVILMDIDMPKMNGIEAVKICFDSFPEIPVLMLTAFDDDDKVFASICAGAKGYVLKNTPPDMLLQYIEQLASGGAPMTPSIAHKVLQQFAISNKTQPANSDFQLSEKEKEVLHGLVSGKSYKMIAAELGTSYYTVHTHIKHIYDKMQVNSATEAVSKALHIKFFNKR